MNGFIDQLLENEYVETFAYFSITVLALIVFLSIFEMVTRYDDWKEVKNGNVSVAMAIGGKIFGICNIFRFAMLAENDSIYQSMLRGVYGFALLLAAYLIFEFMTPFFRIDEEIQKDNRAVGLLSMTISVSMSFVIGAGLS